MSGILYGVGLGPGDPGLITVKSSRLISGAKVIAYPSLAGGKSFARAIAADLISPQAEEIVMDVPMTVERAPAQAAYDIGAKSIAAALDRGDDVICLCEGDPFFYGSFMYLFARLAEDWPVDVVPGVSSLTACAAVSRKPLAALNDVLTILPATLPDDVLRERLTATDAAAIIKVGRHLPRVRAVLDDMSLSGHAEYIEHATMADESHSPLPELEDAMAPYFSMILIHRRGVAWA